MRRSASGNTRLAYPLFASEVVVGEQVQPRIHVDTLTHQRTFS